MKTSNLGGLTEIGQKLTWDCPAQVSIEQIGLAVAANVFSESAIQHRTVVANLVTGSVWGVSGRPSHRRLRRIVNQTLWIASDNMTAQTSC